MKKEVRSWNTGASTDAVTYGYTSDDQLTSVSHTNGAYAAENFSYDANGNRDLASGHSTSAGNRLDSDGVYTYTYDDEGNQTARTKIGAGEETTYGWDHRNRLVAVVAKAGGITTQVAEYTYDALDRRIGEASFPASSSPVARNSGFESASAWTFGGNAGVTGNNSAFTSGNPAAPEGVQVAYVLGNGSSGTMSQSIPAWTAGTYTISFMAAQRGNVSGTGSQALQIKLDGVTVGIVTPSGTNYQAYSVAFAVAAGDHTISFVGTSATSATAFIDAASISLAPSSPAVGNAGFESASAWTFGGGTGVTGNNSVFTNQNPSAPQGVQVAYVLGTGVMSQNVTGWQAGTYTLGFMAAQRVNYPAGGRQTLQVVLDAGTPNAVVLGAVTPSGGAYQAYTLSFAVAAGGHTISFVGTSSTSGTAFVDAVSLKAAPAMAGDADFEAYNVSGGSGRPTGGVSAWTYVGSTPSSAGVTGNGNAFTSSNPPAPLGSQAAYIMGVGSITQQIAGWQAGVYSISFLAAQRGNVAGNSQGLQVRVDGVVVASFTPSGSDYKAYATGPIVLTAGSHTISIVGTSAGSDTAFVDGVAVVPTLSPSSPSARRWTVYDGYKPVLDFDGAGAQTARYLQAGPDVVDEVLARENPSGVAWYLADRLGTIRDLADDSGAIVDHVDYSAFGKPSGETAPARGDRMMGFAGMERNVATGLNLAVHRGQDPTTGRWLNEDPIGFSGNDVNLYRHTGNSAINGIDPLGLEIITIEYNAFISSDLGQWAYEPFSWYYQFKTDDRTFGECGTSRISLVFKIDTDLLGDDLDPRHAIIGMSCSSSPSHRRVWHDNQWLYYPEKTSDPWSLMLPRPRIGVTGAASGNHPYISYSPHIDMAITLIPRLKGSKDNPDLHLRYYSTRNCFPFYEVVVDRGGTRTPIYTYKPWWSGPGLIALTSGSMHAGSFKVENIRPTSPKAHSISH